MNEMKEKIIVENLNAWFGNLQALKNINIRILPQKVTAIIGPSGCGKSTFIRCLNRMHEVIPNAKVSGKVILDGEDIYSYDADPIKIRRKVGMVFQKPNPFPTMSIYNNVASGLKLNGIKNRNKIDETVEKCLKMAALWNEVKDKLYISGAALSGGQQQRLCIARALAVEPEVILFDEPCSALDPVSTSKIEELIFSLKSEYTIIIVTHNMQQAARVSNYAGFFLMGELIEFNLTEKIFTTPSDKRTEDYISGRFG
jgi:phosphate transport system ATP-binding protein